MAISSMDKDKAEMDETQLQEEDCNFLKGWCDRSLLLMENKLSKYLYYNTIINNVAKIKIRKINFME